MQILVSGLIAQYALGGLTWDYLQYVLGFSQLGHEVWYLEDSGLWPYDPIKETITEECAHNVRFLQRVMSDFGMEDRWIYRNAATGCFYGAGESKARELFRQADVLVNVSVGAYLKEEELGIKHLMLIDTDPLFFQVDLLEPSDSDFPSWIRRHDTHFTFGLCVGEKDCEVPTAGLSWKKTLPPISLQHWPYPSPIGQEASLSTVMNWSSYASKKWAGKEYGQKNISFPPYRALPKECQLPFALVMAATQGENRLVAASLREQGWSLYDTSEVADSPQAYQHFLQSSRGEWSVAKHGYVASKSGWFSGRTGCYLALGRPAIVQETGWSEFLPSGEGLLGFRNPEEARAAIEAVMCHYAHHSEAARAFAEQYLEASRVCQDLLDQAGIG